VAVFAADANSKLSNHLAASQRPGYVSTFQDTMPHVAVGGDWVTVITIMNFRSQPVKVPVSFTDDNGTLMKVSVIGTGTYDTFMENLSANGSVVFETEYRPSTPVKVGMARLDVPCDSIDSCGNVGAFATFRWMKPDVPVQEAVVQTVPSLEEKTVLAFNNQNGYVTGVAISQPKFLSSSTSPVDVTLVFRDGSGNRIILDQIRIPAGGHTSFVLTDKYPQTAGKQGMVEFTAGDSVAALALLFTPSGAFSTSPSFQPE
jgi:hypothetical protein